MLTPAFLIAFLLWLWQAVPDTLPVPEPPSVPDTLQTETPALPDTLPNGTFDPTGRGRFSDPQPIGPERPRRPQPVVIPKQVGLNPGFTEVFTDSLQRWEQWYNLAERRQAQSGAISFRLGSHGRNDAILFRGIEPRHQQFLFEGIPLNNTVSGAMNSNFLPLDRMRLYSEHEGGIRYTGEFALRRFYLNTPLTWINFEDTSNDVRRAEVIFSRNINRSGNIELAYRGNNDNGNYRRSSLDARQASVRYTHYLNEAWSGQAQLFYNSFQMNESDGYTIPDMNLFNFEPLLTPVRLTNARSSTRKSVISASLFHRPDEASKQQSRFHLYHNRDRRIFYDNTERLFYRAFSYGAYADTRIERGLLELQPLLHLRATVLDDDSNTLINRSAWTDLSGGLRLVLAPAEFVQLGGWSEISYRTDGQTGYEAGYRFDLRPTRSWHFWQSLAVGEVIPTIQQLFWFTENFLGDDNLNREQIIRAEAGLQWGRGWIDALGVRAYGSRIGSPIVMNPETGVFQNIDAYQSLGAEVFADFETSYLEAGISATVQRFFSSSARAENQFLDQSGIRNTNRAYFYLKNYFLNFATYAKIGGTLTFSPNAFHSPAYYPELDYWDPLSPDQAIPAYYRFDLEASARVRMLMVQLRYENLLDGLGQLGYFETARYPMPPRRFRIAIRWIIRN